MASTKCCVCLEFAEETKKISALEDPPPLVKLQTLVPEVDWLEDYEICKSCRSQLDIAYDFRNFCIRNDANRKDSLTPKIDNVICYYCSGSFSDKESLIEHISIHQKQESTVPKPQKFDCTNCDKSYSTKKVLKAHVKKCSSRETSQKGRTFSCEVCNTVMSNTKKIIEHCYKDHSIDRKSVKPYKCDECSMRFVSSANLIQHKKYHGGSRSYICCFCGKSFITKSDLTVHEYTHFNRRNYKCEFCGKAFNTNKNLWSHILVVHTDSSLWKHCCDICSRRFPLKSGYEQHMKRHTGDKKFGCQICEKSFVSRTELMKHMAHHSVVKAFKCEFCDKGYKEKRLLDVHVKKEHPKVGNIDWKLNNTMV